MRKLISIMLVLALLGATGLTAAAAGGPGAEVAALLPFFGDSNDNRLADDLDPKMAAAGDTERIPVIVMLNTAPGLEVMSQFRNVTGDFDVRAEWELAIKGFAADLTKGQIKALARNPMVTRVDLDREVHAFMNQATYWTGVQAAWSAWGVSGDRGGSPTTYSGPRHALLRHRRQDFRPSGKDIDFGWGINLSYNTIKQAGGYSGAWSDDLVWSYNSGSLSGAGDYIDYYFQVTVRRPFSVTLIMPDPGADSLLTTAVRNLPAPCHLGRGLRRLLVQQELEVDAKKWGGDQRNA